MRRIDRSAVRAIAAAVAVASLGAPATAGAGPATSTPDLASAGGEVVAHVSQNASATSTNVAAWVDGEGRLHGAWVEGPTFPTLTPRQLKVLRLTSGGAADASFGTGGLRSFTMETPPADDPCEGVRPPRSVSFTASGEIVVGLYRTALIDNGCRDQPIIERYQLDGARTARLDSGAAPQQWIGAGADGHLVRGWTAVSNDVHVVGPTGGVFATLPYTPAILPEHSVAQLPGGPLYLTTRGWGGDVQVHRAGGGAAPLSRTSTCAADASDGVARVLPGPGDAFARACYTPSGSSEVEGSLAVEVEGPSPWARTVDGTFGSLGAGYLTDDGKVLAGGGSCDLGCVGPGGFHRFGATGSVQTLLSGTGFDIQRVLPIGADAYGWTSYTRNDEGTISFVEVSRATIGGAVPATVPAKPAAPVATPGTSQVALTWTAPNDGGSPITGYRIVPYRNGVAQAPIDVGVVTMHTVTGLTNGASYRFTVAARNAIGLGPASDLSTAVVPAGLPGAPRSVSLAPGNRSAVGGWLAPLSDGGSPVTGYEVRLSVDGVALQTFAAGAGTSVTIPDLNPGTIYRIEVRARNAVGAGPWSALSNAATPPPAVFPSWPDMANRQYQDLLGRDASAFERTVWANVLSTGDRPAGELPAALRTSSDHTGNVDPVVRLYQAYLGRTPDVGGLRYWLGRKRNGMRLTAISSNFATSSEFVRNYGSLSNRAFVELVYQNVLARPGDASGIAYWTRQLDQRRRTRGQVMVGFSESSEYIRKQGPRVEVIVLVSMMLGRAPTAAELDALGGAIAAGTATPADVAQGILESSEYATRIGGS